MKKQTPDDTRWQNELTEEQYRITRCGGTERAFTGCFLEEKRAGTYACVCCKAPLFASTTKYDSGSGWPSYWQPIKAEALKEIKDTSIPFMPRIEVRCAACDAHLGHVFPDGPPPTGLRYCINSAALDFIAKV